MPKKPIKLIPLRCPYCNATFDWRKQNNKTENDGVLVFDYGCGARATLYKFPGGYRVTLLACREQKKPTQEETAQRELDLFGAREYGGQ